MQPHSQLHAEQLLHLFFWAVVFVFFGGIAVGLDLAAAYISSLGVNSSAPDALEFSALCIVVVDVVLFCSYLGRASMRMWR